MRSIARLFFAFAILFGLSTAKSLAVTTLSYHGGPIMQSNAANLIFWLPPGTHFLAPPNDNAQQDAAYESAIEAFFNNLSGTSYLNIITQYPGQCSVNACTAPGNPGAISIENIINDTTPYPNSPLQDGDVHTELQNLIGQHGIPVNISTEFFVFIAGTEQECNTPTLGCSGTDFCAYHSSNAFNGTNIIYAVFPVDDTLGGCAQALNGNGPGIAEAKETVVLSHELFESITDPLTFFGQISFPDLLPFGNTAWWDSTNVFGTNYGNEIGDDCDVNHITNATTTVPLNSAGMQSVQMEWSNDSLSCVAAFGPSVQFLITTGSDDLRGDSTAAASLTTIGGSVQGVTLKASGPSWGNNSTNEVVTALTPPVLPSLSAPLSTVSISMASHPSWPEGTDSWNLQNVTVSVLTPTGQVVCSLSNGGNPLSRMSNSLITLAMPNCPATPQPSPPPPTQFNQMRFVIATGGDNLRSDSEAQALVTAPNGVLIQTIELKAQNDSNEWANNTTKDLTFNLNSPMGFSAIGAVTIALIEHDGFGESDDNWNVQSVNITLQNNGANATCFANVTGSPFVRLTGSAGSVRITAGQSC